MGIVIEAAFRKIKTQWTAGELINEVRRRLGKGASLEDAVAVTVALSNWGGITVENGRLIADLDRDDPNLIERFLKFGHTIE